MIQSTKTLDGHIYTLKSRCKTKSEARVKQRLARKQGWQSVRLSDCGEELYGVYVRGWKRR